MQKDYRDVLEVVKFDLDRRDGWKLASGHYSTFGRKADSYSKGSTKAVYPMERKARSESSMFRPDRGEDIEERDYCGPLRESGSTGRSRRS
jgi:hypothetical protein